MTHGVNDEVHLPLVTREQRKNQIVRYQALLERARALNRRPATIRSHEQALQFVQEVYEWELAHARGLPQHTCPVCGHECPVREEPS